MDDPDCPICPIKGDEDKFSPNWLCICGRQVGEHGYNHPHSLGDCPRVEPELKQLSL